MQQTFTFHVLGMHCASCVVVTETELSGLPEVTGAKASLKNNTITVNGDFGSMSKDDIRKMLSNALTSYGYSLSEIAEEQNKLKNNYLIAALIAIIIFAIFLALQKLGLVNLINASEVGYGTAFAIGLVASLSSCMAVVGGLVLSLSANFAKEKSAKPHIMFHAGRLIGFFILGGALGALGSVFQISAIGSSILSLIIALIMIMLGLNLLNSSVLQVRMPSILSKKLLSLKSLNHAIIPFVIGVITFFLPCGFTQSMQLFALTTNSFLTSAGIMAAFALGTLPVLGLISYGSSAAEKMRQHSDFLFKIMGFVVLLFALFNILNSLAALGIIPPFLNI